MKPTLIACISKRIIWQAVCRPVCDQFRRLSSLRCGSLRSALLAALLAPLVAPAQQTPATTAAGIVGDGIQDDTAAIQALLDSRRALVHLPSPPQHYLISKPLRIYSNQTLQLDRFAVIRLKDGSDCLMITNDDHNLKRTNMDGIHVHSKSRHGRITNLKGATNCTWRHPKAP